jgi:prevent-host-death family protein
MTRIGVRELRQHASRYLDLVKAGETVEVTERGQLVAVLAPPSPGETTRERLIAEGRLTPAQGPRILPTPMLVAPGSLTASEALAEDRSDTR